MRRGWLLMTHELAYQAGERVFATAVPGLRASTSIVSKRQFRLLRPVGSGAGCRRRRMAKLQRTAACARTAIDHDLHGAARPVGPARKTLSSSSTASAKVAEGPHIAIMQQEHHAAAVREPARLDRGMQMKADGEFVGASAGNGSPSAGCKDVLAVERAPSALS